MATKGEAGREEEEEGTDGVPTAQLSLAQVDICPPVPSLCTPALAVLLVQWRGGGWMYGGGERMLGVGGVNQGRQERW